jgi:hypothetical protein
MFQKLDVSSEVHKPHERVAFCGHFELFEQPQKWQRESVTIATAMESTRIAILVGDIGATDKILAFHRAGTAGIVELYSTRIDCASDCQISQLPSRDSVEERIDVERLDHAVQVIRTKMAASPFIWSFEAFVRSPEGSRVVLEEIVLQEIDIRCRLLGLAKDTVDIYQERTLRNLASRRMSSKLAGSPESWAPAVKETFLKDMLRRQNGSPTCRGILLALYEVLEQKGCKEVIQIYSQPYAETMSRGSKTVSLMRVSTTSNDAFSGDRWSIKIRNIFI